jgi:hypothetical protein
MLRFVLAIPVEMSKGTVESEKHTVARVVLVQVCVGVGQVDLAGLSHVGKGVENMCELGCR